MLPNEHCALIVNGDNAASTVPGAAASPLEIESDPVDISSSCKTTCNRRMAISSFMMAIISGYITFYSSVAFIRPVDTNLTTARSSSATTTTSDVPDGVDDQQQAPNFEVDEETPLLHPGGRMFPSRINWASHHQAMHITNDTKVDEDNKVYFKKLTRKSKGHLIFDKVDADFGYEKCILDHDLGFQMIPNFCWNSKLLFDRREMTPMEPWPVFEGRWFHFTGDSLARHTFHGFRCMITEHCTYPEDDSTEFHQPISNRVVNFRHGSIKVEPINNITISFDWSPKLEEIPDRLRELFAKKTMSKKPDAVFIIAGTHQTGRKTKGLRKLTRRFGRQMDRLLSNNVVHDVTFQTEPSTKHNNILINTMLLDQLVQLYNRNISLLDGYWPQPVNDQVDGTHSLAHGHASALRYGWAFLWKMYGKQHNYPLA